jgi:protein-arginine kinase activator protein McsA
MSRPGFVFDLTVQDSEQKRVYVCRNCGAARDGDNNDAHLHSSMRIHLRDEHGLDTSTWKISHHDRTPSECAVCFWPPDSV